MAGVAGHRIIVSLQENETTDFYFPTLAAWGAAVAQPVGGLLTAPPNFDQPHDRNAWVHYAMGDYPALAGQIDNDTVIPFYGWLAKEFVFADHHFGAGSNSTSGHNLAVGGETPTFRIRRSPGRTRCGTFRRSGPCAVRPPGAAVTPDDSDARGRRQCVEMGDSQRIGRVAVCSICTACR
jgi:hypothetical protein